MIVLDPGHEYDLQLLDERKTWWQRLVLAITQNPARYVGTGYPGVRLRFVKREGLGYPGNIGTHDGTTLQECLRACIDRVWYLQKQIPCGENDEIIYHLRQSIRLLEHRAAERHGRQVNVPTLAIEKLATCARCLHIGCSGTCRSHH